MEVIKWLKWNWIQEKLEGIFHNLYDIGTVCWKSGIETNTVIYSKLQEDKKDKKEISGLRMLKTIKTISIDGATEDPQREARNL